MLIGGSKVSKLGVISGSCWVFFSSLFCGLIELSEGCVPPTPRSPAKGAIGGLAVVLKRGLRGANYTQEMVHQVA